MAPLLMNREKRREKKREIELLMHLLYTGRTPQACGCYGAPFNFVQGPQPLIGGYTLRRRCTRYTNGHVVKRSKAGCGDAPALSVRQRANALWVQDTSMPPESYIFWAIAGNRTRIESSTSSSVNRYTTTAILVPVGPIPTVWCPL
jgi:hypothetical protein